MSLIAQFWSRFRKIFRCILMRIHSCNPFSFLYLFMFIFYLLIGAQVQMSLPPPPPHPHGCPHLLPSILLLSFFFIGDRSVLFPSIILAAPSVCRAAPMLALGVCRVTWGFQKPTIGESSLFLPEVHQHTISRRRHRLLMETGRPSLNSGDRLLPCLVHSDEAVVDFWKKWLSLIVSLCLSFSVDTIIFQVLRTQWNRPRFKFTFSFLLATWPWTNHLTSLSLHFLIYKRKNIHITNLAGLVWGLNEIMYKNPKHFARHIVGL